MLADDVSILSRNASYTPTSRRPFPHQVVLSTASSSRTARTAATSTKAAVKSADQLAARISQLVSDIQSINARTTTATLATTPTAVSLPVVTSTDSCPSSKAPASTSTYIADSSSLSPPLLNPTTFHFSTSSAPPPRISSTTNDASSTTLADPKLQGSSWSHTVNPFSASSIQPSTFLTQLSASGSIQAASATPSTSDALSILSVAQASLTSSPVTSSTVTRPTSSNVAPTSALTSSTDTSTNPASSSPEQQQQQNPNQSRPAPSRTVLIASTATGAAIFMLLIAILIALLLRRRRRDRHAAIARAETPNSLPHLRPASSSLLDNMLQSHPNFFAPAVALANARHRRTTTLPSPPLRPHPALRSPALSTLDEMALSPASTKTQPTTNSLPLDATAETTTTKKPSPTTTTTTLPTVSPPPPKPPPKHSDHRPAPSSLSQARTLAPPPSAYHQRMHSSTTRPGSARPGSTRPGTAGTEGEGVRRSWVTSSSVTAPGSSYNPFDLA